MERDTQALSREQGVARQVLKARRWKAFLRLRGETMVDNDEDILREFNAFVQTLSRLGVDYSALVNVEGELAEHFSGPAEQFHSVAHTAIQAKTAQQFGE